MKNIYIWTKKKMENFKTQQLKMSIWHLLLNSNVAIK